MTDEKDASIKSIVATWALGQPFNNVLLMLILGSIMYGTYFAMTTAIPKHLEQIQSGYESLTNAHREERKELRDTYSQWMQRAEATSSRPETSVAGRQE